MPRIYNPNDFVVSLKLKRLGPDGTHIRPHGSIKVSEEEAAQYRSNSTWRVIEDGQDVPVHVRPKTLAELAELFDVLADRVARIERTLGIKVKP